MAEIAIAVDGPASSGKGTVARGVARQLGYAYVDTGAMYRSVAMMAARRGVAWDDAEALGAVAASLSFRFTWDGGALRVEVDGEDVTRDIRADEIGTGASKVSAFSAVRRALLSLQRSLADEGGVVMDGRDIGTVVLPEAQLKVFLTASLDERARRRHAELVRRGDSVSFEQVREAIERRDAADSGRAIAPLEPAVDSVRVDTTELSITAAIERVLTHARERGASLP